jgi:uncharacterized iron-regulated membrane protein
VTRGAIARWRWVHSWTSLICTLFLLMLCITGLPLIFIDEIDRTFAGHVDVPELAANTGPADLDKVARIARERVPGETILYIDWGLDEPLYGVNMAPAGDAQDRRQLVFDARTGDYLEDLKGSRQPVRVFLGFVNRLHIQLFAGRRGELFLGAMGVLFLAALVSGTVIYTPYMRKVAFGTVRGNPGHRRQRLDLHNLIGIATLGWLAVVGASGTMNTVGKPAYDLWRKSTVPALIAPYKDVPLAAPTVGIRQAVDSAHAALPGSRMVRVTPPSATDGSPWHYVVWTQGDRPFTRRLFRPVLVDAQTGGVTLSDPAPWYLTAIQGSRPLHFGDYGGLPLKILWAVLDVLAIVVLITGVQLWWSRRRAERTA